MAGKNVKTGGGGHKVSTIIPPLRGTNSVSAPGKGVIASPVRTAGIGGKGNTAKAAH